MTLTPEQLKAIETTARLAVVIACAGSGKTTVIAERVKWLIAQGVNPEAIAAITYTNAAAFTLSTKIGYKIGFAGTLHELCLKLLRQHGERIGFNTETLCVLSEEDSETFIEEQCKLLKYKGGRQELRLALLDGIPASVRLTSTDLMVGRIFHTLKRTSTLTYDAILVYGLKLILKLNSEPIVSFDDGSGDYGWNKFYHLLLDEAQDASDLDWAIYNALPVPNKFIVADPRQSLFEWRKGNPGNVLALTTRKDVETHYLHENFRSGQEICDLANKLAKDFTPMMMGLPKKDFAAFALFASAEDELAEIIRFIKWELRADKDSTSAILLRTNALVEEYRPIIHDAGFPNVTVCTFHAAKSKEWDIVFLPALEEGFVPLKSDDVNECRRMLYVGMTRAKRMLLLGCAKERKDPWSYDWISNAPSRYLKELGLI